jgi:uncharacterized protein
MTNKLFLSFEKVRFLQTNIIRDMMRENWKPTIIVGLARGGLVPAVCLSHWYNVPMLPIKISFRDWVEQQDLNILVEKILNGDNVLILDDINDTGKTLHCIKQTLDERIGPHVFTSNQIKIAVLVNNLGSTMEVNYTGMEINKKENDVWVVFPWEDFWYF